MMQSVFMAMMCDEEGTINLVLMMLVCFCSRFDARSCVMVYSYATVRIKLFAFESNMGCSYYSSANFIYSTYNDACKLQLDIDDHDHHDPVPREQTFESIVMQC